MHKIIKNFISEEEKNELLAEIEKIKHNFKEIDKYRKNIKFSNEKNISKTFLKIKDKIINKFNLKKYEFEDRKKFIFINYFTDGAVLHRHAHVFDGENIEVRFNILLSSSGSGSPIINDEKIEVSQKDLWIFNSCLPHWSDIYRGEIPRIAISYGFHIPINEIDFLT
jgi:hypothetical protein